MFSISLAYASAGGVPDRLAAAEIRVGDRVELRRDLVFFTDENGLWLQDGVMHRLDRTWSPDLHRPHCLISGDSDARLVSNGQYAVAKVEAPTEATIILVLESLRPDRQTFIISCEKAWRRGKIRVGHLRQALGDHFSL